MTVKEFKEWLNKHGIDDSYEIWIESEDAEIEIIETDEQHLSFNPKKHRVVIS